MKKISLLICLLSAFVLNAQSHGDKLSASEIASKMESFRDYKWGAQERPYEIFIYAVYHTGTGNKAAAAEIEKKAVAELKENKGGLRYKMLLAQCIEIVGVQNSADALADIIEKNAANAENRGWVERIFNGLAVGSDKSVDAALKKLTKSKNSLVATCAVTSLGRRGQGDVEIATLLKAQTSGGFKNRPLSNACIFALSRIANENCTKFLYETYKAAKLTDIKQMCAAALFSSLETSKNDALAAKVSSEIMADKNAYLGAKIEAYTNMVRRGAAPAPTQADFTIAAIDLVRENKGVKIPDFLALSKLEEPLQVLMVQALTRRGEGYADIIKLTPKSADLAEAVSYAASKMGSDKDYEKLMSFANLYADRRQMAKVAYYIASIKTDNKVMKVLKFAQGNADSANLASAVIENLDSSSAVDELLKIVSTGSPDQKSAALKTLTTALEKNDEVFVKVAKMYGTLDDASVSAAQRLLVNCSRVRCTAEMFAAAKEQYASAKDAKAKTFFLRFAPVYGGADAAEFLAGVYTSGLKKEALSEFAKWTNENAFASLQKLEKSDAANKAAIRDTMVVIVQKNNLRESPIIKYISDTATNSREKNLINMLEMPNFGNIEMQNLAKGLKGKATHNSGNLRNAVDGDIGTRWDTGASREKGMGILFELPEVQTLKAVELLIGSSGGDRVQEPIVYAGESMDDLMKVKITYKKDSDKDSLTFASPVKAKVVCIVNTKDQGGYWSIHEVNFVK